MGKIFLAFPGYEVQLPKEPKKIGDLEFWNLTGVGVDDFVTNIQKIIPPFNEKIKTNYEVKECFMGEPIDSVFKKGAWGILLPGGDVLRQTGPSRAINIFLGEKMPLAFFVSELGIQCTKKFSKNEIPYQKDAVLATANFADFYGKMVDVISDAEWDASKVLKWGDEDWRYFAAMNMFDGLFEYASKNVFEWQRECAEEVSLLELLLSCQNGDNGSAVTPLRSAVLVGGVFGDDEVEQDMRGIYKIRNNFLHGEFYKKFRKSVEEQIRANPKIDCWNVLDSLPDFASLRRYLQLVMRILVSALYLRKKHPDQDSIPKMVKKAVLDCQLRAEMREDVREILSLMPAIES